jgi:hypothetical protein
MDLAKTLLPEPDAPKVPELDPENILALRDLLRLLVSDVREQRPEPDTEAEMSLLMRMSVFGLEAGRLVGSAFADIMRLGLNATLGDLVRKELETADTERKLALRQLEQAAHTFGVLTESLGMILSGVPADSIAAALEDWTLLTSRGELRLQEHERTAARFQLELLVALECMDAPIEELTYWAFRAITSARKVEALPAASLFGGLRGELARARARRAWQHWDEREIEKELAPWPSATLSP